MRLPKQSSNFLLIIFMVKCSFEVPLQVFSYSNVSTFNILKTNNTPLDLYKSNKLIYTLSMHEMNTSIFGHHDPR
jgi:hypothetical protein